MMLRIAAVALLLAACTGPAPSPTPTGSATPTSSPTVAPTQAVTQLTVMTHDAFAVSDDVLAAFEQQNNVTVNILKSGDAGTMVNKAILAKDAPLADVMYGVDNTFLSRALDAGIFEPYQSPALANIPAEFQVDPHYRVSPVDFGDVCLNYDTTAFSGGTPAPSKLLDLTDPKYKNKLVVENPATSSPGLAFLLATVVARGNVPGATAIPAASGYPFWQDYWQQLKANGVLVSNDWEDAYYNQFSGGAGQGDRPIVVSYATSPAAEVVGASPAPETPPTANIDDACFRQIEFVGLLAGARPEAKPLAQKWIDFMLSRQFQQDMPLNMYVLPVEPGAAIPDVFTQTGAQATHPIEMPYDQIGQIRDQVIQEWTDIVLH
jgi:thiamine transport system substrate-binding protein